MEKIFSFEPEIRFGVEIEVNAFDESYKQYELPSGIHYIANLIQETIHDKIIVSKWGNNHNNNNWIVKPDSSCGIEICSPILKGKLGLNKVYEIIKKLASKNKITCDERCSLHVHFDVSKLNQDQLKSIISWWIKCEMVFMDAMPLSRKINQYCQLISLTDVVPDVRDFISTDDFIQRLGKYKYFSLNTFHYYNKRRKSIEFRIMDGSSCLDPTSAVSWISLLVHFIDCSIKRGLPERYEPNNQWTGYCCLDPKDVFSFLNFDCYLCKDLIDVRKWFASRLIKNFDDLKDYGVFSKPFRIYSQEQIKELVYKLC